MALTDSTDRDLASEVASHHRLGGSRPSLEIVISISMYTSRVVLCAIILTFLVAPREIGRIFRGLWQIVMRRVREVSVPHEPSGFQFLLRHQLGFVRFGFGQRIGSVTILATLPTVNCVVTFRYSEIFWHSPRTMLSQSKIVVEPTSLHTVDEANKLPH